MHHLSLRALAHLAALLLQAASALLLPLPAELGASLLVGVGLVRHGAKMPVPRVNGFRAAMALPPETNSAM